MKASKATSPTTMRQTRQHAVLIVDDHPIVRHGLAQLIDAASDLHVCGQAATASEGLQLVQSTRPDVTIVDLRLEEGDGMELIKQIKAQGSDTRVLVASTHDETLCRTMPARRGHGLPEQE